MHSNYLKLPAWMIVLWLISLQVLSPFVHAHLEKDGIDHASVMHLHTATSSSHHAHDTNPALENPHSPHQILSIAQGLPKKIEANIWVALLSVVCLALFIPPLVVVILGFQSQPTLFSSYRRRSPQPQAPPYF